MKFRVSSVHIIVYLVVTVCLLILGLIKSHSLLYSVYVPSKSSIFSNNVTALIPKIDFSSTLNLIPQSVSAPRKDKIFCWVLTYGPNHEKRIPPVNRTWLPRCDKGYFFTNEDFNDTSVPLIPLWKDLPNSYDYLNSHNKSMTAWSYIYKNFPLEYDWYYRSCDDTYLIMENLKSFLSQYDPEKPYYFGTILNCSKTWCKNDTLLQQGYHQGGGFVISKKTFIMMMEAVEKDPNFCEQATYEDFGLARCLAKLSIYPTDTKDSVGAHRFIGYFEHYVDFNIHWFLTEYGVGTYEPKDFCTKNPSKLWANKCVPGISSELISIHHILPEQMLIMEMLLYHVKKS